MKKFLLGIIIGFLMFPLAADLSDLTGKFIIFLRVPGYGTVDPFIGNCTKDVSKNGHGWVFVNREYYKCGKIAIAISDAIYGEHNPNN